MQTPEISIIVPAYNASKYLPITVDSVLGQSFSNWELIIINDGSKDDTLKIATAIAAKDSRIKVVDQANMGLGGARNSAFRHSNPESSYLIFLDSDDVWEPEALAELHNALVAEPASPAAWTRYYLIDADGREINGKTVDEQKFLPIIAEHGRIRKLRDDEPFSMESLLTWCAPTSPGSVLIRRSAYEKSGGFRNDVIQLADYMMWVNLTKTAPMVRVNRPLFGYRIHPGAMSRRQGEQFKELNDFRRAMLASPDFTDAQKACIVAGWRYQEMNTAKGKLEFIKQELAKGSFLSAVRQSKYMCGHFARATVGHL